MREKIYTWNTYSVKWWTRIERCIERERYIRTLGSERERNRVNEKRDRVNLRPWSLRVGVVRKCREDCIFLCRVRMDEYGHRRRVIGETCARRGREWTWHEGEGANRTQRYSATVNVLTHPFGLRVARTIKKKQVEGYKRRLLQKMIFFLCGSHSFNAYFSFPFCRTESSAKESFSYLSFHAYFRFNLENYYFYSFFMGSIFLVILWLIVPFMIFLVKMLQI